MYYYKAKIQYAGTGYAGFQWQNGIQTVQGEFNRTISQLIGGKISTMAASRTDTGVHAFEQIVKITSINSIPSSLLAVFNEELPSSMKCIKIESCEGSFRPSVSSVSKEYRYFFTNKPCVSKEESQFIANISNVLDFNAMKVCIDSLRGVHDFCNFYSSGSNVKSTIREIYSCELSLINPQELFSHSELFQIPEDLQTCYEIRIQANGFLKQMIRHIVSALWRVGSGKLSTTDFIALLHGPKISRQLWKVASPNGLFLYRINY